MHMMRENYVGKLVIAHPSNPRNEAARSVQIVVTDTDSVTVCLQINTPHPDLTLSRVTRNIGIDHEGDQPVYFGGVVNPHKIHVIHSLDWAGISTVPLTDHIGLTNDISVLMALSRNEGPEYFRACAGYWTWEDGRFERELTGTVPRSEDPYRWEVLDASIETVFQVDANIQWNYCIEQVARQTVSAWL